MITGNELWVYILAQFINVILSTIKYIVTIKSKPITAGVVNAASYTVGALITYFIVKQDIMSVIIVTFISNFIGVPFGKWIVDKIQKDRLWIYNATINCSDDKVQVLKHEFKDRNIDSIYEQIIPDKRYSFRIFSYKKEDSVYIKEQIAKHEGKYYITEPR